MKRFYIRTQFIYKIEHGDYQTEFLDSIKLIISKKIIKLMVKKMIEDCNEQKLRLFLKNLVKIYQSNIELLVKTDETLLYDMILNIQITEILFQPIFDFFKLFKLKYEKEKIIRNANFLSQNINNYYIIKTISNNYEFDIQLSESFVVDSNVHLFEELMHKIIVNKKEREKIENYLLSIKNQRITHKLLKTLRLDDNHETKINYLDLGCHINNKDKECQVCGKYVDLPIRFQYEENNVLTEIKNEITASVIKQDFATLLFYFQHYKGLRTIFMLEDIIKLIFVENINNEYLFRTFNAINFNENLDAERILDDLFCFISNNQNLRQYENCINIFLNINLTDKLALGSMRVLYNLLKLRNNHFTKLMINFVVMQHSAIYKKNLLEIFNFFVSVNNDKIKEILEHFSVIFDIEYNEFIEKYLYEISNVVYINHKFDFIENNLIDQACVFVCVYNILNQKNPEFDFYGYKPIEFIEKYSCKIFPLLLMKKFDLFESRLPLFINCKDLFMKNFVGILFNLRMYYKNKVFIEVPCIFDIFVKIFKFLDDKIMLFFNHFLPFIEYFSSDHKLNQNPCINSAEIDCLENCLLEFYSIIKKSKNYDRIETILPYFETDNLDNIEDMSLIFNKLTNLIELNNKSFERIKGSIFDQIFWKFLVNHKSMYLNRYLPEKHNVTSERRKITVHTFSDYTSRQMAIFGSENYEICKISTFFLLCKYNVENFNNFFNSFYSLVCQRFIDNHKLFSFLGSIGANKIIAEKQHAKKYIYMESFSISTIAIFLIENYLVDFNYDMQDLYFFIIQETLKFVDDKSNIQKSTYQFIKHFEDTKYHYNFEFKRRKTGLFQLDLRYRDFLTQFLSSTLVLLLENDLNAYFDLLKYGVLLHSSVVEFYSLSTARLLVEPIKKELLVIENELSKVSLHKVDKKNLKFILKLNIFCGESMLSEDFLIKICIYLEEYHFLLRIYEQKYNENKENHLILQSLYYLIGDYDNSMAMNKIPKTISSLNIFFDLCFERDFLNAIECFKSIVCNEIEFSLLERIIHNEKRRNETIQTFTEIDFSKFDEMLRSWDIDDQFKINILHLNYDYQLLKTQPLHLSLGAIEYRRKLVVDKEFFIGHHAKMFNFIEKDLCGNFDTAMKIILQEHKIKLKLENIKILRRNKNLIKCKELITRTVLDGKWAGLYEDAKLKVLTGNNEEARSSLARLLMMIEPTDFIYDKTIIFMAKLENNKESYVNYLQKLPYSEKLYFRYAQFLESIDQYAAIDNYLKSYFHGVKYTNYLIPRVIHLICEVSDDSALPKKCCNIDDFYLMVYKLIYGLQSKIDFCDWIPYFNHILSKMTHKNDNISTLMVFFLTKMITLYPEKVLWHSMYHLSSKQANIHKVITSMKEDLNLATKTKIAHYLSLSKFFLSICSFDCRKRQELSLQRDFNMDLKYKNSVVIPNSALNCILIGFEDKVMVFNSLQSPKKLTLLGEDGKKYHILCKPNDDLRKDIRFMDINRTLNEVFSNHQLCQNDALYIRTYSVFALNTNNGIIEWINGLISLKSIIDPQYQKIGKSISEEQRQHRTKKKIGIEQFSSVLTKFPPVFSSWFNKFYDPIEYYKSRQRFIRTYAVMNIVGWFMGLGDRHLENIMIDSSTADTFHVDLNCLFDSARRFEIPEKVPFRLTQNIVDAFGPLKIEGTYRKTAEICLKIMIEKKDLIITNLLSFVYDPVDNKAKKNQTEAAKKLVNSLIYKLDIPDVCAHVNKLIEEATNENNLSNMYIGWASFI